MVCTSCCPKVVSTQTHLRRCYWSEQCYQTLSLPPHSKNHSEMGLDTRLALKVFVKGLLSQITRPEAISSFQLTSATLGICKQCSADLLS